MNRVPSPITNSKLTSIIAEWISRNAIGTAQRRKGKDKDFRLHSKILSLHHLMSIHSMSTSMTLMEQENLIYTLFNCMMKDILHILHLTGTTRVIQVPQQARTKITLTWIIRKMWQPCSTITTSYTNNLIILITDSSSLPG